MGKYTDSNSYLQKQGASLQHMHACVSVACN